MDMKQMRHLILLWAVMMTALVPATHAQSLGNSLTPIATEGENVKLAVVVFGGLVNDDITFQINGFEVLLTAKGYTCQYCGVDIGQGYFLNLGKLPAGVYTIKMHRYHHLIDQWDYDSKTYRFYPDTGNEFRVRSADEPLLPVFPTVVEVMDYRALMALVFLLGVSAVVCLRRR
jgi:hypothetical protein